MNLDIAPFWLFLDQEMVSGTINPKKVLYVGPEIVRNWPFLTKQEIVKMVQFMATEIVLHRTMKLMPANHQLHHASSLELSLEFC